MLLSIGNDKLLGVSSWEVMKATIQAMPRRQGMKSARSSHNHIIVSFPACNMGHRALGLGLQGCGVTKSLIYSLHGCK